MEFDITHSTEYTYGQAAAEAYVEARLTPPTNHHQTILSHRLAIDPEVRISNYSDYFKNEVSFFSLPYRHQRLAIRNHIEVRTHPVVLPTASLDTPVQEARQIFASTLPDIYDYLQPTEAVTTGRDASLWARRYLPANLSFRDALTNLNQAIYTEFVYRQGSTDNLTPLATVWKQRRGVCQDFAHIMLSVLRTAGMPCRYICGYIETDPPPKSDGKPAMRLVGAVATHAWVEVMVPGMIWVALDPTNNQWCGERHVTVSYGRDANDATPVRGTFKGAGASNMKIQVVMRRRDKSAAKQKPAPIIESIEK